jgi:hypothetical protein
MSLASKSAFSIVIIIAAGLLASNCSGFLAKSVDLPAYRSDDLQRRTVQAGHSRSVGL